MRRPSPESRRRQFSALKCVGISARNTGDLGRVHYAADPANTDTAVHLTRAKQLYCTGYRTPTIVQHHDGVFTVLAMSKHT